MSGAIAGRIEDVGLIRLGTLRADGWPGLGPVEPLGAADDLHLGMVEPSSARRRRRVECIGWRPEGDDHLFVLDITEVGSVVLTGHRDERRVWRRGARAVAEEVAGLSGPPRRGTMTPMSPTTTVVLIT